MNFEMRGRVARFDTSCCFGVDFVGELKIPPPPPGVWEGRASMLEGGSLVFAQSIAFVNRGYNSSRA